MLIIYLGKSEILMSQKLFITIEEIFRTSITNNTIKVRGWIYRTRSSGNIVFIMLRDSTGYLQATIKLDNIGEKEFKDAKKSAIFCRICRCTPATGSSKSNKSPCIANARTISSNFCCP